MRSETVATVEAIKKSLALLRVRLDRGSADKRLDKFNLLSEDLNLWADPKRAQKLMRQRQALSDSIESFDRLETDLAENIELLDLGESEGDSEIVQEAEDALRALLGRAQQKEIEALLSGEADGNDTFLEIHSGAGGTESCDWARMLVRMYNRWAQKSGYNFEIISQSRDGEAGLKSGTYRVNGHNAYGWLKTETGVHRLVRKSPFDSAARRHTSFSSVWVYPVVDENIQIDINSADLRIDTYRSSGSGGQHVNTTDSAVRVTHAPTGIVVTSSEKSQHQNRAICMNALRSRLYEIELRRRSEKIQEQHSQKGDAGWGHQIRSYVLEPYQMVKDLRTNYETSNTQSILDGNLDDFMAAVLAHNVVGKSKADASFMR